MDKLLVMHGKNNNVYSNILPKVLAYFWNNSALFKNYVDYNSKHQF